MNTQNLTQTDLKSQKLPEINQNAVLGLFENLQLSNEDTDVKKLVPLNFPKNNIIDRTEKYFFKIKKLAYDKDYPHREAFENVLLSLNNIGFNFVYVLEGLDDKINLYLGVVKNGNKNTQTLDATDYGQSLRKIFEGNFNGSELEDISGKDLDNFSREDIFSLSNISAGVITGIPSVNEFEKQSDVDFQGIDRLINSMHDLEDNKWRIIVTCEPVSKEKIHLIQESIYDIYNNLSLIAKQSLQHSQSSGSSESTNISDTRSTNTGRSETETDGHNTQHHSTSKTIGSSAGTSKSHSESKTESSNSGRSDSITLEKVNKYASEMMKYIDEELLPRMKLGFSKGFFKSSVYYMTENPSDANRLKTAIQALFQGNKSSFSPLCSHNLLLSAENIKNVLTTYQSQFIADSNADKNVLILKGIDFDSKNIGLSTLLTSKEISLIAGLPQTEVPGINLMEAVDFGLNERAEKDDNQIELGKIVQKGRVLDKLKFTIPKKNLMKHTFIAGVTGSGKTTTCHKLLYEADTNFLVLEPAKTEYRTLINSEQFQEKEKQIVVFTLGNETVAPFRLNPFEMVKGEILSSHIDMIKATFTSAFPMEASMPQILEEAIYGCYKKRGWDVDTNTNERFGDEAYSSNVDSFPIMSDLLEEMKAVVETKNFGSELKANYIGSLVSRLSNLTVGSKGNMLNCEHSTDFNYIATHNVIIEMEELKSPEDKSLFMGFILSHLTAVIRQKHKEDSKFRHITLVEEAHRLLSKVEYGDSGSKKSAVETFTDLLAEVRKYGEGLVIVDQIPNKLAPEVLKNTNTKIIHKILAKDDKEAVGDCMLMDDKQKEYLSALEVGNAIVFTEGTYKPVHVKIESISNTNEDEILDEVVASRFSEKETELGYCYKARRILKEYKAFCKLCDFIAVREDNTEQKNKVLELIKQTSKSEKVSEDKVLKFLLKRRFNLTGMFMSNLEKEDDFKKICSLFEKYLETSSVNLYTDEDYKKLPSYFSK